MPSRYFLSRLGDAERDDKRHDSDVSPRWSISGARHKSVAGDSVLIHFCGQPSSVAVTPPVPQTIRDQQPWQRPCNYHGAGSGLGERGEHGSVVNRHEGLPLAAARRSAAASRMSE